MKKYHLSDILSVTTGKLVSTRHMGGIYDILNYMTGANLKTEQLPRASEECKPCLLEQLPQLEDVTGDEVNGENYKEWLQFQIERFGEFFEIEKLQEGMHLEFMDIKNNTNYKK
ncbi:hypothetical protein [uncultured Clostridium sp.]|uniref:DUF7736 domain-containing protein n=1 Tax=uncultured Clostridium sp. TaxID=59620 RepID=UPI0028F014D3|nr:hypothetical protein [uncultured Clostridium sp.]